MLPEREPGALGEHREQEHDALQVGAVRGAAREAEARRRDERLHLDQQRPRALERWDDDAARHAAAALLEEHARGVGDLAQSGVAHLEDADLVGRAEAVLGRAEDPEGVEALALQVEHRVDDVLEHARPGDRALLGHVPDEEDRDVVALRDLEEARGALAELRDAASRGADRVRAHRLDRVDDREGRTCLADRLHDRGQVRLGEERDAGAVDAEAASAELHLNGRLLAGDVEDGPALAEPRGGLHEQAALADAGVAAEQDERPADHAAAEHAVELGDAGRDAVLRGHRYLVERDGHARRARGAGAALRRGDDALLDEAVPALARRAAACPLRRLEAALLADEGGLGLGRGHRVQYRRWLAAPGGAVLG